MLFLYKACEKRGDLGGTAVDAGTYKVEREKEQETTDYQGSQTGWQNLADEGVWEALF